MEAWERVCDRDEKKTTAVILLFTLFVLLHFNSHLMEFSFDFDTFPSESLSTPFNCMLINRFEHIIHFFSWNMSDVSFFAWALCVLRVFNALILFSLCLYHFRWMYGFTSQYMHKIHSLKNHFPVDMCACCSTWLV